MSSSDADGRQTSRRRLLAAVAAATAVAGCLGDATRDLSAGTDTGTDWPRPRYDARRRAYAPDAAAPRTAPERRWRVTDAPAVAPPVVADGAVYLATTAGLIAYDAADGRRRWTFTAGEHVPDTAPTVHDGLVFVTAGSANRAFALDTDDGAVVWETPRDAWVSAPPHLAVGAFVPRPTLFVGTARGRLLRVDPATGAVTATTDQFGAVSTVTTDRSAVGVYVGTHGGSLYRLGQPFVEVDGRAFRESWRRTLDSRVTGVVPSANCLAVATRGGPVRCLDHGSGATAATFPTAVPTTTPALTPAGYVAAGRERAALVRSHDTEAVWSLDGDHRAAAPVAAGDTVYLARESTVEAVALDATDPLGRATDRRRWRRSVPGGPVVGLAVADGAVFVASRGRTGGEATLTCLEA